MRRDTWVGWGMGLVGVDKVWGVDESLMLCQVVPSILFFGCRLDADVCACAVVSINVLDSNVDSTSREKFLLCYNGF